MYQQVHISVNALSIYYCAESSNLTTSEPSPREDVVELPVTKKIKTRETGTPRSSWRMRRETPARRDNKHQDARDGNAPLVGAHEMGKPPLVVITKSKMRETGTPRSSQRARRETLTRRDNKKQDA
jgi:hypothetical protein